MKALLTLDNNKLLVLNNSMQVIDTLNLHDQPKNRRSIVSICIDLRTELLQKGIKSRQKDKSYVMKLTYYKADALWQYLHEYAIFFPDDFGSYEDNVILQIKNELHRQLL